jgi:hypothetical protein
LRPLAPNPAHLALHDDHTERRVAAQQVVRGPQAGEPRPDHADVGLGVAGERRPGRELVAVGDDLLVPQRQ